MALNPSGRNRKASRGLVPLPRQPNGQHRREPRMVSEAKRVEETQAVALKQPHRRGDKAQPLVSPIGRMILWRMVPDIRDVGIPTLLRAAELYTTARARLRWVENSMRPFAVASGGDRPPPEPDEKEAIIRDWSNMQRMLRDCLSNQRAVKAMKFVLEDKEVEPDFDVEGYVSTLGYWVPDAVGHGLAALVDGYGLKA